MNVSYTERARRDLASIAAYLTARNPRAADRVGAAIRRSIERLRIYPLSGRRQDLDDVRKIVVPGFAYLVYYRIGSDAEVVVLTIRHSAQQRLYDDT